jgi:hypothetical protein
MMNVYKLLSDVTKYQPVEKIYFKIIAMFMLVIGFTFIFSYYYSDGMHWYRYNNKTDKMSVSDTLFYTFTCWFTLGYGEIIPKSYDVKLISVLVMISAYLILLL